MNAGQVTVLASLDRIPLAAHIEAVDDPVPPGLPALPAPNLVLAAGFGPHTPADNLGRAVSIVAGSIVPVGVERPVFLVGKLA